MTSRRLRPSPSSALVALPVLALVGLAAGACSSAGPASAGGVVTSFYPLQFADDVDLALTYDYNLAPASFDRSLVAQPLGSAGWDLGVPAAHRASGTSLDVLASVRERDWIVNSRNTADEEVVRTLASLAGFSPRVVHRADSLELVQDMIVAGLGVGLLPAGQPVLPGVRLLTLRDPDVTLRAYAVTRAGRGGWPPLALVLRLLEEHPLA